MVTYAIRHTISKALLFGLLTFVSLFFIAVTDAFARPQFSVLAKKTKFSVASSALQNSGEVPIEHSCWVDGTENPGEGMSPLITWKNLPPKTNHIAILVNDPDADFLHWFILIDKKSPYFKRRVPLNVPDENDQDIKAIFQQAK